MSRKRLLRHSMSDSEEMRIRMYLVFGGFHYRTVARRVYGNGHHRYEPTDAEVARVGRVARANNLSSRDWRNGVTDESRRLLNRLGRVRKDAHPRLTLVA